MKKLVLDIDNLTRRYLAGESVLALSKALGISRLVIMRRLREAGIATRSYADGQRLRYLHSTPEERLALTHAAHAAVRGVAQSEEHRCKVARFHERHPRPSFIETDLALRLEKAGIITVPQKAVGRYNVDLAIAESRIAVEVFGGNWHTAGPHAARFRQRCDYLLNRDWLPVIVWVDARRHPLTDGAIDYLVALHQRLCAGKSRGRQEHVIWGTGERIPRAQYDPNNGSTVKRFEGTYRPRGKDGRFTS